MFARDRDLLLIEPNVFRDVGWAGQRLVSATGSISGTTLSLTSMDVTLEDAGIGAGDVATVGGVSHEIIERLSSSEATISRVRGSLEDDVLPPSPATNEAAYVMTFGPQLALTHAKVIRMFGLEAGAVVVGEESGLVYEGQVVNAPALATLEALGTLHLIYAAASGFGAGGAREKAEMYAARFDVERQRAVAMLDLDGDGAADATRRASMRSLRRG